MKNKKRKIVFRILTLILICLIFLLIFLVLINIQDFSLFKKAIKIEIKDECSLMLNNIIHQIKDQDICKMMCSNECEIRGLKIESSAFFPKENSCSSCDCYCK
jgi:hypothetical protein